MRWGVSFHCLSCPLFMFLRVQAGRRYDARTTIFSPEGRLYQVEYAMEAIGHAGAAVGVLSSHGIVLAAEKKITSKLLEVAKTSEKMYIVDKHVACAVAVRLIRLRTKSGVWE